MINIQSKIFIAGHRGMLGSSILRIFKKKGYKNLITVDKKKLDLRNQLAVKNFLKKKKPHAVIIAAAKDGGIKAKKLLKWSPKISIDNLIDEMIEHELEIL